MTTNIPTGISTIPFEKYIQEEYHHRGKGLDPDKLDRKKNQEWKCCSKAESDSDG